MSYTYNNTSLIKFVGVTRETGYFSVFFSVNETGRYLEEKIIFPENPESGRDFPLTIFRWYGKWLREHWLGSEGPSPEQVPPTEWDKLGGVFKTIVPTTWSEGVSQIIFSGIAAYTRNSGNSGPVFRINPHGRYMHLYRSPTEPRFGALKAEKGWAFTTSWWADPCPTQNQWEELRKLVKEILTNGWKPALGYFGRPAMALLENRERQSNEGCLVKTGKVLEHLLEDFPQREVLASYVQDALREGCASVDKIKVTDDVGSIYRKGGDFVSCMRFLGQEKPFDVFQIYRDLGARVAYMTKKLPDGTEKLVGRAILWDCVYMRDTPSSPIRTVRIMDTIYRDGADEQASFVKWARQQGYAYKTVECSYGCRKFTYGPDRLSEDFELDRAWVKLPEGMSWKHGMYAMVPWVDLFCYIEEGGTIAATSSSLMESASYITLHYQDGKARWLTDVRVCENCGVVIDRDLSDEDILDCRQDESGNWWCPRCVDLHWETCCICGDRVSPDDWEQVGEHYYCPHCDEERREAERNRECCVCGWVFQENDARLHNPNDADDSPYCVDCYAERWRFCESCQQDLPADEVNWYENLGVELCNQCVRDYYAGCEICDNIVVVDDIICVHHHENGHTWTEDVCPDCYQEMVANGAAHECICGHITDKWDARCDDPIVQNLLFNVVTNHVTDHVCPDCFDNKIVRCGDCGDWVARHTTKFLPSGEFHVCPDCQKMDGRGHLYICGECGCIEDDRVTPRHELLADGGSFICNNCFQRLLKRTRELAAVYRDKFRRAGRRLTDLLTFGSR